MSLRSLGAYLSAAALLLAVGLPRLTAKPPDLPVDTKETLSPREPAAAGSSEEAEPAASSSGEGALAFLLEQAQETWEDAYLLLNHLANRAVEELLPKWVYPAFGWNGYSSDLNQLINQPEDLRQVENEWDRFWFNNQPSHLTYERIHGNIEEASEPGETTEQLRQLGWFVLFGLCPATTQFGENHILDVSGYASYPLLKVGEEELLTTHDLLHGAGVVLSGGPFGSFYREISQWGAEAVTEELQEQSAEPPFDPLQGTFLAPAADPGICSPISFVFLFGEVPGPMAPATEFSCPYLKRQTMQPQTVPDGPEVSSDVASNLKKLEQARKLYGRAEAYRGRGQYGPACFCYEIIRRRCPGSRYARLAAERLQEVQALAAARQPGGDAEEQEPGPVSGKAPTDPGYTCPYLRQQEAARNAPAVNPAALSEDIFENLHKLDRAEQLYRRAEHHRQQGRTDRARACYQEIHRICPGSRYDVKALKQLGRLNGAPAPRATENAGEEQEPASGDDGGQSSAPRPDGERRVARLLKACHRALADGRQDKAEQLARRAQQLAPEQVAADPLVYKMHLLLQVKEIARSAAEAEACAPAVLRPPLPSVDPRVVEALEKVLNETAAGEESAAQEEAETPAD